MKPTAYAPQGSRAFFVLADALRAQTKKLADALRAGGLAPLRIERFNRWMRDTDFKGVLHPVTWELTGTRTEGREHAGVQEQRAAPVAELWVPEWAARVVHAVGDELASGPGRNRPEQYLSDIRGVLGFMRDDVEFRAAVCAFLDVCDMSGAGRSLMELSVLHDCRRRGFVAWPKPSAMSWPDTLGAAPPFWLYLARLGVEVA